MGQLIDPHEYYRVDADTGCWVWLGAFSAGRPRMSHLHRSTSPRKVLYEDLVGPVNAALYPRCRNRVCVNPHHMGLGLRNPHNENFTVNGKGCWLWRGATSHGYAIATVKRKTTRVHRMFYEAAKGKIPKGLQLDHLCRERSCVNPDHLEPVTHAENGRRGSRAKMNHETAARIRTMYADGWTQATLAKAFNVSFTCIHMIVHGKSWA